jgi:hypothetical protein
LKALGFIHSTIQQKSDGQQWSRTSSCKQSGRRDFEEGRQVVADRTQLALAVYPAAEMGGADFVGDEQWKISAWTIVRKRRLNVAMCTWMQSKSANET